MHTHTTPEFTPLNSATAIGIAFIYIVLTSFIREPNRQKFSALLIAGAGAVYWSGGLGIWEFIFGGLMLWIAMRGLNNYTYIGIGWLLHTGWDILHHFYGSPIVYLEASSSAGCAVCDPFIALWYFWGAPNVLSLLRKKTELQ